MMKDSIVARKTYAVVGLFIMFLSVYMIVIESKDLSRAVESSLLANSNGETLPVTRYDDVYPLLVGWGLSFILCSLFGILPGLFFFLIRTKDAKLSTFMGVGLILYSLSGLLILYEILSMTFMFLYFQAEQYIPYIAIIGLVLGYWCIIMGRVVDRIHLSIFEKISLASLVGIGIILICLFSYHSYVGNIPLTSCPVVTNVQDRDACYAKFISTDVLHVPCESISNYDAKLRCYFGQVWRDPDNTTRCDVLSGDIRTFCFQTLAWKRNDTSLCFKVSGIDRGGCYGKVIRLLNIRNDTACDIFKNRTREVCRTQAGIHPSPPE
jgi:hypothetical protein